MIINELMKKNNISSYKLSRNSGISYSTISDICSGKANLLKCSAITLYKIAKVLNVSVEYLIEQYMLENDNNDMDFEVYKSNVCHRVKDIGDLEFIIETIESGNIRNLYNQKKHLEAFYLLAMTDYLSRINKIPLCKNYNDIRSQKLKTTYYPKSICVLQSVTGDKLIKENAKKNAIKEFLRFNIVESDIRNVC